MNIITRYPCKTEHDFPHLTTLRKRLRVGDGSNVEIWKKNTAITYTVDEKSFISQDDANLVREAIAKAAKTWNITDIDLKIQEVGSNEPYKFIIKYMANETNDSTLADSFFPATKIKTLTIYEKALEVDIKKNLSNVLEHELGHMLGLRHEYVEPGSVQFGMNNSMSVMSDKFPPMIQNTDLGGLSVLYNLEPGSSIGKYKVIAYN